MSSWPREAGKRKLKEEEAARRTRVYRE